MNSNRNSMRPALILLAVAAVVGVLAVAATTVQAVPSQQQLQCTWKSIGTASRSVFHVATAMDTDASKLYIYGGVDESFKAVSQAELADLSGATFNSGMNKTVANAGARSLVGSAGAYRAKGKDNDLSAAYFFGGIADPDDGAATDTVQRFLTKSAKWEVLSPAGSLGNRAFAAAAYDPVHDVIWVTGGIRNCKLTDVLDGSTCNATAADTMYMSFDPTTGEPKWNTLAGASVSSYAHTMVYDSIGKRMLLFGGTSNIKNASSSLSALDLSDPDPAKAKIASVATSGTAPSLYFHGAGFQEDRNWMVVYGGVKRDFLLTSEQTNTATNALDLSKTPAAWVTLSTQGNPGDRVAGGMAYVPQHKGQVFVLGRQKIAFSSDATPQPEPKTQKSTYGLECKEVVAPPTNTPGGLPPGDQPMACPGLERRVPQQAINDALANPATVQGFGQLCFPSQPPSPFNVTRRHLSLRRPVPYNPLFNGLIYKCGCP